MRAEITAERLYAWFQEKMNARAACRSPALDIRIIPASSEGIGCNWSLARMADRQDYDLDCLEHFETIRQEAERAFNVAWR